MSTPSTRDESRERLLRVGAVVGSVAIVLYGVLVAGQILLPVVLLLGGFVVYLVWRFVRAHERIAAATERIAAAQTATAPPRGTDESLATGSGAEPASGEEGTEPDSTEE